MTQNLKGIPFDANEIVLPDGSLGYDNILYSEDFANWLRTYFKNGVLVPGGAMITTQLEASLSTETQVKVDIGNMVINGRTTFIEEPKFVDIDKAGPNMERYDLIVIELNLEENINKFRLMTIQGVMSSTPIPPELTRTDTIHQMALARVKTAQSGIVEITDLRSEEAYCGISQVLIGVRTPMPVTGDTADNISYDNASTGLDATTVQGAIDILHNKAEIAGNVKSLLFENITVLASSWVSIEGHEESKFAADIPLQGVTEDMIADVIFMPNDADSGIISGSCIMGFNKITLLAKKLIESELVIPTIVVNKVVN